MKALQVSHERAPKRAGSDGASSRNVPVHVLAEPDRRAGLPTHQLRATLSARGLTNRWNGLIVFIFHWRYV
jgi:hypothetical protein